MKIHKEGYKIIFYSITAMAVLNTVIIYFFIELQALWITLLFLSIIKATLIISFFRIPERMVVEDPHKVFSAADGRVVAIEETEEKEYFQKKKLQVSIFMNLFNVHYNTYPVSGTIKYVKYHPGKYYPAYHPKSSVNNERVSVVIETEDGIEIMIRQIAGLIARRIVTNALPGLIVKQGEEMGFIKFGSRVDIFLPPGTKTNVNLSQPVHANRDVLADI